MDKSILVISLALITLVLVMAWAYLSKRKAKAELGSDRPLTGNARTSEDAHTSEEAAPVRHETR